MMSVFFFFKQKKAYEMRISDWSADVCSSDLRTLCAQVAAELAERVAHVGRGAHLVVGQAVDDHRHAARRVALVADLSYSTPSSSPVAFFNARSMVSLGMLIARPLWIAVRRPGLLAGSAPPLRAAPGIVREVGERRVGNRGVG